MRGTRRFHGEMHNPLCGVWQERHKMTQELHTHKLERPMKLRFSRNRIWPVFCLIILHVFSFKTLDKKGFSVYTRYRLGFGSPGNVAMSLKKSLTMTMPFIKIEANDSCEGVMSVSINNHQLSLIAALLSIYYGKGGDSLREGRSHKQAFWFFCCESTQPWVEWRTRLA